MTGRPAPELGFLSGLRVRPHSMQPLRCFASILGCLSRTTKSSTSGRASGAYLCLDRMRPEAPFARCLSGPGSGLSTNPPDPEPGLPVSTSAMFVYVATSVGARWPASSRGIRKMQ